ncbi:hypothetical protein EIN_165140 [Entamoeba invadens IP1]|uniref:Uncharacterized protein n=1 Tax=Entamoeba invadens IP1 TaxID=370355 RepID=A0A0A1UA95_ENTIV|nr:hypothetical protein EIN_165140 [Entamoeba invadens IP1]ELP89064.1 hypothetical protein EIN_165140 [Entamoeba invadens IP1]|eukprot:XP_004255835.1 hypothetical protein EIN_165140 [Entamoeba invadens IP1]
MELQQEAIESQPPVSLFSDKAEKSLLTRKQQRYTESGYDYKRKDWLNILTLIAGIFVPLIFLIMFFIDVFSRNVFDRIWGWRHLTALFVWFFLLFTALYIVTWL